MPPKDPWSAGTYASAAGFVPLLTTKVLAHLSPRPTDLILDIGSGDGVLTRRIATATPQGHVLGLDASPAFIASASAHPENPTNASYALHDCSDLPSHPAVCTGGWDQVFSNAAMHWILRAPDSRAPFFRAVHAALAPGGSFVFEMGGHGNVAEVQTACIAALGHAGVPVEEARAASPWFFPGVDWMRVALEEAGFDVEVCESEYRPTKLTEETADGKGGIEGWVRLMCGAFLEVVGEEGGVREGVVREVCEVLGSVLGREGEEGKWLGYVRLRGVGRKR